MPINKNDVLKNLEYDYPCVHEDLEALNFIADKMEVHIATAINEWENS